MAEHKESPKTADIFINGRGRFLRLEEAKPFEAGGKPRYEATFILDPTDAKQAADIKNVLERAAALAKEHYGKVPLAIKKLAVTFIPGTAKLDLNDPKNEPDNIRVFCLQDGNAEKYKNYAGYPGKFIIASSQNVTAGRDLRPDVRGRQAQKVRPGDPQYPYDGANVKGCISFWLLMGPAAQKTGPLVGCNLRGVQFVSDNEAFQSDEIDADFEALEDAPAAATSEVSAFD